VSNHGNGRYKTENEPKKERGSKR